MLLTENIRIAFRGLSANKLRAALTMLGWPSRSVHTVYMPSGKTAPQYSGS